MGSIRSKKGKGSYATYRTLNTAGKRQEARAERHEKVLAKRKEWRISKLKGKARKGISGTTDKLFYKWGIPVEGR